MTLDNIKTATTGIADPVDSAATKLFPAVLKMVQNMPGGVAGLVKQFQDKGLRNVAASLTAASGTRTSTPEQIVQGLGTYNIDALATASGLDTRVVRKELVTVLPRVLQELAPAAGTVVDVAVTG